MTEESKKDREWSEPIIFRGLKFRQHSQGFGLQVYDTIEGKWYGIGDCPYIRDLSKYYGVVPDVAKWENRRHYGTIKFPESALSGENQKEGCSKVTEEIQVVQKEPWEMTQREIIDQARKSKGWNTKTSAGWKSKSFTGVISEHRAAIKEALKEGKPVPAEVLEAYPELLKPEVDVKRGDKVVVQGLKDTYEGVVVSVRDNNFTLSTPQFVKMQWNKGDIIQVIPGEEREESGVNEPKLNRGRHRGQTSVGYLK